MELKIGVFENLHVMLSEVLTSEFTGKKEREVEQSNRIKVK